MYSVRDEKGRFTKNIYKTFKNNPKVIKNKIINHIALVVDASGSMSSFRYDIVNQFNQQLNNIKDNAIKTGQETRVSLYTFSDETTCVFRDVLADKIKPWNNDDYIVLNNTALYDAVGKATEDLYAYSYAFHKNENTSFLVIVLTDGYENYSKRYSKNSFKNLINERMSRGNWTFALNVPQGFKNNVEKLGIPSGNINEWEITERGLEYSTIQNLGSTQSYFTARSMGANSVSNFYQPDFSQVTSQNLNKLQDSSKEFLRLEVKEDSRIDKFVEKTTGNPYVIGSGLYQLTKSENVQEYKNVVIRDRINNYLYKGLKDVRRLLKLPATGTLKLRPSISGQYDIFVQSTAPNRKLLAGTVLLLDKNLI